MQLVKMVAFVLLASVLGTVSATANGAKGKVIEYRDSKGDRLFSVRLEQILFNLNSVENKYKVVRLVIRNDATTPLDLDVEKDIIEVQFSTSKVTGILDMFRRDEDFWDGLPADIRKQLAYPKRVPEREEESIFVFLPKNIPSELPKLFRYNIKALSDDVVMQAPIAKR